MSDTEKVNNFHHRFWFSSRRHVAKVKFALGEYNITTQKITLAVAIGKRWNIDYDALVIWYGSLKIRIYYSLLCIDCSFTKLLDWNAGCSPEVSEHQSLFIIIWCTTMCAKRDKKNWTKIYLDTIIQKKNIVKYGSSIER